MRVESGKGPGLFTIIFSVGLKWRLVIREVIRESPGKLNLPDTSC